MSNHTPQGGNRLYVAVLVVLLAPFFLNDFSSIAVKDWRLWLLIDYVGVKLVPLAVIFWAIRGQKMPKADFGLAWPKLTVFAVACLAVTLVGTLLDQNGYRLIAKLPGYSPLGAMPAIGSDLWNWIDLTFGLIMVGVAEELVFRGYMLTFLSRFTQNRGAIVLLSSLVFGAAHWSQGLHAVVITASIGAVFMVGYLRARSLYPVMLAHFAINFIDFSGVIPKEIFQLG